MLIARSTCKRCKYI